MQPPWGCSDLAFHTRLRPFAGALLPELLAMGRGGRIRTRTPVMKLTSAKV